MPISDPSYTTDIDEGHRAPTKLLKRATTIQTITSNLQSLSHYAPSRAAFTSQARRLSEGYPGIARLLPTAAAAYINHDGAQGGAVSPIKARVASVGEEPLSAGEWDEQIGDKDEGGTVEEEAPQTQSRVVWSAWDELLNEYGQTRRILLSIYGPPSYGLQMWDCSDLTDVVEVLNAHGSHDFEGVVAAKILNTPQFIGEAQDVDAAWKSGPLLAVLCVKADRSKPRTVVRFISLRDGKNKVVKRIKIDGHAVDVKANDHFFVISTYDPPALHIFATGSLAADPCSPITDIAPHPVNRAPAFDLGRTRLLMYATNRRMADEGTTGIAAGKGWRGAGTADDLDSGAAQVGKVARMVGGGVMTGVKALGTIGYQYWHTPQSGTSDQRDDLSSNAYSKSAPQPSYMPSARPGSSAGSPPTFPQVTVDASIAGHVLVVDLQTRSSATAPRRSSRLPQPQPKTIAHFRPTTSPIALLSLSPDGTQVLTGSIEGHAFHIFELHPNGRVSQAPRAAVHGDPAPSVWHRYRLDRGRTASCPMRAGWSSDGKFVAISSQRGTTHVFGIRPDGGLPSLQSQLSCDLQNGSELQPLSVPLAPLVRVRPPAIWTLYEDDADRNLARAMQLTTAAPPFLFMAPLETRKASARLLSMGKVRGAKTTPRSRLSADLQPLRELLLFYPSLSHVLLARIDAHIARSSDSSAVGSGETLDIGAAGISGLTQAMRTRSGYASAAPEWRFNSEFLAAWDVKRSDDWDDLSMSTRPPAPSQVVDWSLIPYHWASQIEIDTFSRSLAVLPRTIYLSHQFNFNHLPSSFLADFAVGDYRKAWRPLKVRQGVEIREGSEGRSLAYGQESIIFGEPMRNAMDTYLDPKRSFIPSSPSASAPTFPNGVPGKHGRWNDGLPIRVVPPNLYDGFGRLRRELGRVTTTRRQSHGSFPASVSFEDDDDDVVAIQTGSYPTPGLVHGASESDGNSLPVTADDDADEWALDAVMDDDEGRKAPSTKTAERETDMAGTEDEWNEFPAGRFDDEDDFSPAPVKDLGPPTVPLDRASATYALAAPAVQHSANSSPSRKESIMDLAPPIEWTQAGKVVHRKAGKVRRHAT